MEDFGPQAADAVLAACCAGAADAAESLTRALDAPMELVVGEAGAWDPTALPKDFGGPGLVLLMRIGAGGALLLLSESSGLLPDWYANPDATGVSKLATLAQELGMLLLPEQFMSEDFAAARVTSLSSAAARGGIAAGSTAVSLTLSAGEGRQGTALLVWPVAQPDLVLAEPPPTEAPIKPPASDPPTVLGAPLKLADHGAASVEVLPLYSRSLLRIKVPVMVSLASKKQAVGRILELVPGSILQFNKSCDELLDLEVVGRPVARGECVKVGDKFGLRITQVTLPDERFKPVR